MVQGWERGHGGKDARGGEVSCVKDELINQNIIYIIQMSRNGVKRSRTSQVPIFISKLYEMIDDRNNAEIISWTSTSDSFSIHSISKFTEDILPVYFKHRNFASFIRQLNMYGFRKIRHSDGDNVYMNDHFKQGAKHLLKNITRKIKEDREEQVELYRGNRHEDPAVSRQIQELRTNQKNLEELCRHFIAQNQRLLEENQNIVRRMEQEEHEKERKLEELLVFLLTQKDSRAIRNNNNGDQVLSITNYQHPQYAGRTPASETPLEALGNAMDDNQHLHKARQLIQGIYGRKNKRRENNCTIVQPKLQESNQVKIGESTPHEEVEVKGAHLEEDDKSFMSINDFLNVEDGYQHHFDLDSSV